MMADATSLILSGIFPGNQPPFFRVSFTRRSGLDDESKVRSLLSLKGCPCGGLNVEGDLNLAKGWL